MASSHRVISLPVAVHVEPFRWQLDLFWFGHRQVYGREARLRTLAIVIKRNKIAEKKVGRMSWNIDVPHSMCEAFFDIEGIKRSVPPSRFGIGVPLNIQTGLMQILPKFPDDQLLEVIDCDMGEALSPNSDPGSAAMCHGRASEHWRCRGRRRWRGWLETSCSGNAVVCPPPSHSAGSIQTGCGGQSS